MLCKLCARCGCVVPQGETYCKDCAKKRGIEMEENLKNQRRRAYLRRDPKHLKFYQSKAWKTVKEKALKRDNFLCQKCKEKNEIKLAAEVHHKVTLSEDFSQRLTLSNLVSLCTKCHNDAHGRRGGAAKKV